MSLAYCFIKLNVKQRQNTHNLTITENIKSIPIMFAGKNKPAPFFRIINLL